jgi:hypothetical protein
LKILNLSFPKVPLHLIDTFNFLICSIFQSIHSPHDEVALSTPLNDPILVIAIKYPVALVYIPKAPFASLSFIQFFFVTIHPLFSTLILRLPL